MLRAIWAVMEVFFGALLAFGVGHWRNYSCITLFIMSLVQVRSADSCLMWSFVCFLHMNVCFGLAGQGGGHLNMQDRCTHV